MAKKRVKKDSKAFKDTKRVREDEYQRFITWTATPREYREDDEKDQKDFAVKYDLDVSTLSLWKRDPAFWAEVNKRYSEITDRIATDIRHILQRTAKEGNVSAIKLYLQYEKQWSEKIVTEHRGKVEIAPEDAIDLAEQILDAKKTD